jgi:hypothetical protein
MDPVQAYLTKYGQGGKQPVPPQAATPVDSADPVQAYLAKYGKGGTGPAKPLNRGSGLAGGAQSVLQGLLGGFADEIGAAGSAAIDTGSDILHGRPTQFKKNYVETRDVARELDKGFEEAHPSAMLQLKSPVRSLGLPLEPVRQRRERISRPELEQRYRVERKSAPFTARETPKAA